ncbi:hypothetical protein V6N13_131367 [Hibiscus sabdariffa]
MMDWVFSSSPESTLCAFSSNFQSRVSSPPRTSTLLCFAAEEAARVQRNEESYGGLRNKGLLGPPAKKPSPNLHPPPPPPSYLHQSLSSLATQQQPQPQNRPGIRAVFSGNPTGKGECAGTGVFLPRRTAGPTVLLPARVVQALNLNLDEINSQPHLLFRFNVSAATDSGAGSRHRSVENDFGKQNKFRQRQGISHEIRLPQEWTY